MKSISAYKHQALLACLVLLCVASQYLTKVSVDLKNENPVYQAVVTFSVAIVVILVMMAGKSISRSRKEADGETEGTAVEQRNLWAGLLNFFTLIKEGKKCDNRFLVWSTIVGTVGMATIYWAQAQIGTGLSALITLLPWVAVVTYVKESRKPERYEYVIVPVSLIAVLAFNKFDFDFHSLLEYIVSILLLIIITVFYIYQDQRIKAFTAEQGTSVIEFKKKVVSILTLGLLAFGVYFMNLENSEFDFTREQYFWLILRGIVGTLMSYLTVYLNADGELAEPDAAKRLGLVIGLFVVLFVGS